MKVTVNEARERCPQFNTLVKKLDGYYRNRLSFIDLREGSIRIYFVNKWEMELPVTSLTADTTIKVIRQTCDFRPKDYKCPRLRIR